MFEIPKTMRAIVYRGINDLRLETVPAPEIGDGELLVKVAVCGVCPTDIKKIHYGLLPPPRIYGHETAGTIVKIGAGKTSLPVRPPSAPKFVLKVGDRVALHHHVPCMVCHFCRHRAFAQCPTNKLTGITAGFEPAGGGFAEYVRVMPFVLPGVVRIPARNTFDEAAMFEPLNTVLKAVNRLNVLAGDRVLVAGQGPIGLMFTKLLKLRGAQVLATDLLESRLKLARKFGAKWAVNAQPRDGGIPIPANFFPRPARGKTPSINRAAPFDAAVIAVPSDAAVRQALQMVRGGGQIMLFAHTKRAGTGAANSDGQTPTSGLYPLDLASICVDEKDLMGSYAADFTIQDEVGRLIFSREFDMRKLITHRFPLEKAAEAVALAAHPTEDSLKVVVT
ncbi:MAG TPA: alcohol dehydrogenase catalytic domain-containing protein, partial [Verrucomicrobiae bacterium]|nr:alcohol dehydrogenase catalytic domain-containing protein [Verrucomicrobiae bacterium]